MHWWSTCCRNSWRMGKNACTDDGEERMPFCYLFTETLTETDALCIGLDDKGQINAPLMRRPFAEIVQLAANARCIAVMGAETFSILTVELPPIGEQKVRAALPFALEERLAQPVETLHFAFDRAHYANGQFLVVAGANSEITNTLEKLETAGILPDSLTLDWFALKPGEACAGVHHLLVHDATFNGALSPEMVPLYSASRPIETLVYTFSDSNPEIQVSDSVLQNTDFYTFVATRLYEAPGINLCQGNLRKTSTPKLAVRLYQLAGVLGALLITGFIGMKLFELHRLNVQGEALDTKIATLYRSFFPEAKVIISPRFRVSQWLKAHDGQAGTSLWGLLERLARARSGQSFDIQQLRYRAPGLSVTFLCNDFSTLEAIENLLRRQGGSVTQTEAASHEGKVLATLELK
ncbi:type II secretion system protein GspL [Legionella geestiana]|nr:type II secretion system protein GspL [Legionella geestiana]QBS13223.1 hypothetical protein E4T54_10985 [Legionella geestiana]